MYDVHHVSLDCKPFLVLCGSPFVQVGSQSGSGVSCRIFALVVVGGLELNPFSISLETRNMRLQVPEGGRHAASAEAMRKSGRRGGGALVGRPKRWPGMVPLVPQLQIIRKNKSEMNVVHIRFSKHHNLHH